MSGDEEKAKYEKLMDELCSPELLRKSLMDLGHDLLVYGTYRDERNEKGERLGPFGPI